MGEYSQRRTRTMEVRFPEIPRFRNHDLADWYHERIEKQIREFEEALAEDESVLVTLPLNDGSCITVTWFGYHNPNMIIAEGLDQEGQETKVLLPQTEVQVVIKKVGRVQGKKEQIGFQSRPKTLESGSELDAAGDATS
jgi:hypothetical protein